MFIELCTDPFEANYQRLQSRNDPTVSRSGRAGLSNVRRPLRGMELKEDTYAALKVIRSDGSEVPFMDSSSETGESTSYSNFILQSVTEARMEKHQIIETFGDAYIYFFGESPRFLEVQAVLINSNDFNWEAEWWANWDTTLRGTKSVENGARTYMFYDDNVVEGYLLMAQAVKISSEPFMVQLSWRMFISSYRNVSSVGDPNFPVPDAIYLPPDVSLTDGDAFSKLNPLYPNGIGDDQGQTWADDVENNSTGDFGTPGRLADLLARGTRSVAFPASVQAYIDDLRAEGRDAELMGLYQERPLRGLISDNTDEYTGAGSGNISPSYQGDGLPEMQLPTVRDTLEVDDLFQEAISWMACFGADINSYKALSGLGMGVKFGAGVGVGVGFGTGISAGIGSGATFGPTPRAGVGFGGTAGTGFGFGANAGTGFSAGAFAGAGTFGSVGASAGQSANGFTAAGVAATSYSAGQLSAMQGDVLFSAGTGSALASNGVNNGLGDPNYGYDSPYGGAGYGQAGFGDYGGAGYGAGFGISGDPGFLPPSSVTFAGVENASSDLDRLLAANPGYGSGFGGVGAGDSYAGAGGGASVAVSGVVSAFALFAAPGTLAPGGSALTNPRSFTATGKSLGLTPTNPYGVPDTAQSRSGIDLLSLI